MRTRWIAPLLLLLAAVQAPASDTFLSSSDIAQMLHGAPATRQFSPNHPDYPVVVALQALDAKRKHEYRKAIQMLEPVMLDTLFNGLSQKESPTSARLLVSTVGTHALWRELVYLTLGQCYYALNDYDRAWAYLRAVPDNSAFSTLARIESVWTALRMKNVAAAEEEAARVSKLIDTASASEKLEFQLERSFLALEKGDFEGAVAAAESVPASARLGSELQNLRSKLLAQSYLNVYLKSAQSLEFPQKKAALEKILKQLDSVQPNYRDPDFSFLAGETYWQYASVLRIEDPSRYRDQWRAGLAQANNWIGPWVDRSIQQGQALLGEDAYFLSVSVLWEQERKDQAVPRLLAIPRFFPQGEYREDTYQLLADHYYDSGDFGNALRFYSELAKVGSPDKAAYGVYKAAWTFYNEERKWKALRHLERLVLFYREQIAQDAPPPEGSLMKEAQQDMLLVMAELLGYKSALSELEMFGYPVQRKLEARQRLAQVYKEIGRYEDSANVWQSLLADPSRSKETYEWLKQLMLTLLIAERRDLLAPALDRYWQVLPAPKGDEEVKLIAELQKQVTTILLTIHREARKTDDEAIWKATDALYKSFAAHFPDAQNGDVWYFGAQRKEQLGDKWGALEWYRKSAEVAGYANIQDSALSVLRLAKDLGDAKGQPKKDPAVFKRLDNYADWYIKKFPKSTERKVAEFLHLDYAYQGGEHEKAHEFLLEALKTEGATKNHQEQYLSYNRKLYDGKQWNEAYQLASKTVDLLESSSSNANSGFLNQLRQFKQETAFEAAFGSGQARPGAATAAAENTSRPWYEKAIADSSNPLITLKAWNNLLVSYNTKTEAEAFKSKFSEFETKYRVPKDLDREKAEILASIYGHAAEVWETLDLPIARAKALSTAANYEQDPTRAENYRWDALVHFGTYYEAASLKRELETVKHRYPNLLKDPANLNTVARLLFWNGDYRAAWDMIRPIIDGASVPTFAWIEFVDLYNVTKATRNPLFAEIKEYVIKGRTRFVSNPVLQSFLSEIAFPEKDFRQLGVWRDRVAPTRALASATGKPESGPAAELKNRVENVGSVLKSLQIQQQELTPLFSSPVLQASAAAICALPTLRDEAVVRLERLKSPTIASGQWGDFVKKLDTKITEIRAGAPQERENCEKQKRSLAYMRPTASTLSPLCDKVSCFVRRPESVQAVVNMESDWKKEKLSRLEKVHRYLLIGAWAPAETVAYSSSSAKERSLLLALIRLALDDAWNASSLLREAVQDTQLSPHARLLLARTAWRHGYIKQARDQASVLHKDQLLDWEQQLYDEMDLSSAK